MLRKIENARYVKLLAYAFSSYLKDGAREENKIESIFTSALIYEGISLSQSQYLPLLLLSYDACIPIHEIYFESMVFQ